MKLLTIFDAVLLGIALLFGVVLALAGKPYGTAALAVHKLAALGSAVLTAVLCWTAFRGAPVPPLWLAVVAAAGLSVIVLFASGALMSAGNAAHRALKISHIASSALLTACEIAILAFAPR